MTQVELEQQLHPHLLKVWTILSKNPRASVSEVARLCNFPSPSMVHYYTGCLIAAGYIQALPGAGAVRVIVPRLEVRG